MIQNVSPAGRVGFGGQQVLGQKHLIYGAGYLRHQDAVVGVDVFLLSCGEVAVHGVAQLVSQGEGIVQGVGVVEKHIGVDSVHAAGVGAGGLALVFVNVDPLFVISLVE